MVKQNIDVAGQYMIGQTLDGTPKVAQMDSSGKLLTSGGGGGGGDVTIVGDEVGLLKDNQLPSSLVNGSLRIIGVESFGETMPPEGNALKTANMLYGYDEGTMHRIGSYSDALKVKDIDNGNSGTGINPPAGGSGKLGWLSGIYKITDLIVTTLLNSMPTSLGTNGGLKTEILNNSTSPLPIKAVANVITASGSSVLTTIKSDLTNINATGIMLSSDPANTVNILYGGLDDQSMFLLPGQTITVNATSVYLKAATGTANLGWAIITH